MKTFRIYAKEVKIEKDGQTRKFLSYSLKSGKTFYNVKFRKECTNIPTTKGYYLIEVNEEDVNIAPAKDNSKYQTVWVKNLVRYTRDVDFEAKVQAEAKAKCDAVLEGSMDIFD